MRSTKMTKAMIIAMGKTQIFAFFSSLIVVGCTSETGSTSRSVDELEQDIVSKGPHADTTFLQFTYGMSPAAFRERLSQLGKSGSIFYDYSDKEYKYDVATDDPPPLNKIRCSIYPRFYNDELYEILLLAKDDGSIAQSTTIANSKLSLVILHKYGATVEFDNSSELFTRSVWLTGRQRIKVYNNVDGAVLSYTDLYREHLKDSVEKQESLKQAEKTNKDL